MKIQDITDEPSVDRELVLVKVKADAGQGDYADSRDIRARIVDIGPNSLIIEATGDENKINAIEDSLRPFGFWNWFEPGR